jgi:AcrR family transcriptional regulator
VKLSDDSQSSGTEDSTRTEGKTEALSKDALLAALLQRHQEDETILWQGPALALAAQAFLLTTALASDTSSAGRVISTLLAIVTALMSMYLVLRKRQELDSVVQRIERVDRDVAQLFGELFEAHRMVRSPYVRKGKRNNFGALGWRSSELWLFALFCFLLGDLSVFWAMHAGKL